MRSKLLARRRDWSVAKFRKPRILALLVLMSGTRNPKRIVRSLVVLCLHGCHLAEYRRSPRRGRAGGQRDEPRYKSLAASDKRKASQSSSALLLQQPYNRGFQPMRAASFRKDK